MKLQENQYEKVLEIVKESLNNASSYLGISFYIESIYLYGSQLSNKKNPNDIDIFVYALEWESDCLNYENDVDMYQAVHKFVHEKQPQFSNLPIDINVKSYDFDLDGYFIKLKM